MSTFNELDAAVLVAGAGPVGLMTAVELKRRGVDVIIVDPRDGIAPWAKAVGVQPRTLEILDQIGVVREALDACTAMRGQLTFVDGAPAGRIDMTLPDQIPYHFIALPQYETERVLSDHFAALGGTVQRGRELVAFSQDETGVTATIRDASGERSVRTSFLVGCDGAHSTVRKGLGLTFEGDAFPEEYMLADVEVDWDLPPGYAIRSTHLTDGVVDDVLVCIPLPGRNRYRMSMLVPDELKTTTAGEIAHGLEGGRAPELRHIQAVLDRLAPQPTTASTMRWSSVFRISHRLVDRYGSGRVFVAGDAAHIHPPTGAQGMNTGLQDAYNLGWKLALAVHGVAAPELLESYSAERHPIGEEVVGRTVRAARAGMGAGEKLSFEMILQREAQLLLGYPDSPIVGEDAGSDLLATGPRPGDRAPDATGLRQDTIGSPVRFHEFLRHPEHTLLIWAADTDRWRSAVDLAGRLADGFGGRVRSVVAAPAGADIPDASGISVLDGAGHLAQAYGFGDLDGGALAAYLIRPDGYVGFRTADLDPDRLREHLGLTLVG